MLQISTCTSAAEHGIKLAAVYKELEKLEFMCLSVDVNNQSFFNSLMFNRLMSPCR